MSEPFRYEVLPLPGHQTSFLVEGVEKLRWHFGTDSPRPFFFPFHGPSNVSLTRMGHPGAPNHDHHCSIWFAHNQVTGVNFWANTSPAYIRQREWLCYQEGPESAEMAVLLDWFDGHDPAPLLTQTLIASLRLHADGGTLLEIQAEFTPQASQLELGQTNFGLLAVRVARELSAHFGGGQLRDSEGRVGEAEIFGQQARWMDYSGPVTQGTGADRKRVIEGITYFDHPQNISYPSAWHVREDGWMGASVCRTTPVLIRKEQPLVLRYLLHAHPGEPDAETQSGLARQFADSPSWSLRKSLRKHTYWDVVR